MPAPAPPLHPARVAAAGPVQRDRGPRAPGPLRRAAPLVALLALAACGDDPATKPGATDTAAEPRGPAPEVAPGSPALRRLTLSQYTHAIRDLFAADLYIPQLEPDNDVEGLLSLGASTTSVSAYGVELYETAALTIAEQVVETPDALGALLSCTPSGAGDVACAAEVLGALGHRAWRRPLTDDEVSRLADLAVAVGTADGSFNAGLMYGIAAILQSPNFLYRVEHGEGDGPVRTLTGHELATRLSFLLWNSIPDEALLAAAADGSLLTDAGLEAEARRLLADPRASDGVRNLFEEVYHLYHMDSLVKDPLVFTYASPELGQSAREETLLSIEALVLGDGGDFRELFTTQRTFVDRRLAALYGVPAVTPEGFGEVTLPDDGGRRGLFGQASFLLLQSHATSSSATRRGKFIRTVVLCQDIPAPPADVDTAIPEADATSPTLRERLETHLTNPSCAGCHTLTDPIGLGFENFDGIARWRTTENGATIDASGDLDGVPFADAWELGEVVAQHERVAPCMTRHLYRYGTGRLESEGEQPLLDWLSDGFTRSGYRFSDLLVDTVLSDGFRTVGELQ